MLRLPSLLSNSLRPEQLCEVVTLSMCTCRHVPACHSC